jgi:hypothetical protein
MGCLQVECAGSPGIRRLNLQPAPRRQRRLLFERTAAAADDAAWLHHLFFDARGSGLRHFPADTHLIDWLAVKGIAVDMVTDHDLDRKGVALLKPYRAVVTGSHPEYHPPNTLNAFQDYVDAGGRLAYLGGNGF